MQEEQGKSANPNEPLLPYGTKIDLTNCDREPIHVPGHIQPHGVLFCLAPDTLVALQVAESAATHLGLAPAELLGAPFDRLLAPADAAALHRALAGEPLHDNALHLVTAKVAGRGPFHLIGHRRFGSLVLELDPVLPEEAAEVDFYAQVKRSIARIEREPSLAAYCQAVAEEVRRLSGYDRVMIYRFGEDWSGHVFAESFTGDKGLSPFLDLHYPASDIPSQARALFLLNTVRMLPDARYAPARLIPELHPESGRPVDMTYTFLRGASQMYTEYLNNMGVRATLTLAISRGDALWGMIACHHYGEPRRISYGARTACELLARLVSLQIEQKQAHDEAAIRARIAEVNEQLVDRLARRQRIVPALAEGASTVKDLVDCGGAAVISEGAVVRLGATPDDDALRALVTRLREVGVNEVFATDALTAIFPPADALLDTAAGLLALPIAPAAGEYVLWFRPEVIRTVKWGGDPHKPVELGPLGDRLTPRKSFALWEETVRGRSEPFRRVEIEAARRLRLAMTEVVFRRSEELARLNAELARLNAELARSNADLDAFAYAASHDLKEPLRGIYNYASFLLKDAGDKLADDDRQKAESVIRLARRMQGLIDSLLHYARVGKAKVAVERVDLNAALAAAKDLVGARIEESRARVVAPRPLPEVTADRTGVEEVFVNLLSNAMKYSDGPGKEIEIGWAAPGEPGYPELGDGATCFYVRDHGIGIAERHYDAIFRIFKRLHAADKFGGGTGTGLTIARRIVERHGGKIWPVSVVGQGTTFWFTLSEGASP